MRKLFIIALILIAASVSQAQIRASYTLANWKTWFSLTGTNSGDVTLAGAPNYITIAGQTLTLLQIDLSGSNVTGTLAAARFGVLTGDVTTAGGSYATTIANSAVTLAKMANMATSSLIYRKTAGAGAPEVNSLATLKTDLGLTGTNSGDQTITLTSDVTGSGTGSFATTIVANAVTTSKINNAAVTLAKIANAGANSVLVGSGAAGTGTAYSEIALGSGLAMTGTTLSATGTGGTVTSVDVAIGGMTSSGAITTSGTITMTGALNVNRGGTGAATLASNGMLYGNGTSALNVLAVNATATNKFLTQSSSAAPAWAALVSGDIPNNGANTTGNAATLTTPRAIYGNNFDGSAALTQIIASTYGGTGNGFAKLSGPTSSEKTFTLPDASAAILTDNAAVTVAQGGTGRATLTNHGLLIGAGTSALTQLAVPAAGQVLTSVASADPAWSATPTLGIAGTTAGTLSLTGVTSGTVTIATADAAGTWTLKLPTTGGTNNYVLSTNGSGVTSWVAQSGGGLSGLTNNGAVYATGSTTVTSTAGMTDGQLLIGGTSGAPALGTLTGTSNQITVTNGTNTITLATPQNISTAATPQFGRLGLGAAADATAALAATQSTSTTNAQVLTNTFSLNCTGTPALNFGQKWDFNLDDNTTPNQLAGRMAFNWSTATHASRTSQFHIYCANGGTTTEYMRIDPGAGDVIFPTKTTGLAYISSGILSTVSYSGVPGRVLFTSNATTQTITQSANFWWDNTNNRLSFGGGTNGNASYTLHPWLSDAATNAISTVVGMDHSTSGTPAAGYGSQILMLGQSSTTASQNMGAIAWDWVTATHASRASEMTFWGVYNAGSLTKIATINQTSASAMTLGLGVAGTTLGQLALSGNTSGGITIQPSAVAGSSTYTIRDQGAAANFVLSNSAGANASFGQATLASGTVTVSTTFVTASSKIFLTDATTGALTNVGTPTVGTITAGTSFVINSSNVLDASNINWFILNP